MVLSKNNLKPPVSNNNNTFSIYLTEDKKLNCTNLKNELKFTVRKKFHKIFQSTECQNKSEKFYSHPVVKGTIKKKWGISGKGWRVYIRISIAKESGATTPYRS